MAAGHKTWAKLTVTVLVLFTWLILWMTSNAFQWAEIHKLKYLGYWNRPNDSKRPNPAEKLPGNTTSFVYFAQEEPDPDRNNPIKGELQDREMINLERVKKMKEYCKTLGKEKSFDENADMPKLTPKQLDFLYVNDKYKLIHCSIPKIACTNFKRLFLGLAGVKSPFSIRGGDVHGPGTLASQELFQMQLCNYSPKEIAYRLHHYTKAIVVRDPMERALSAFRSKMGDNPGVPRFQKRYGTRILQKYHPELPKDALEKGVGVTFKEFVHYLTDRVDFPGLIPYDYMDPHWAQYISLCNPCSVQYNIIAKYETLAEDVRFILKTINASDVITWPGRSQYYFKLPTSKLVAEAVTNFSFEDLKALWDFYDSDYNMFGYEFKSYGKENVSLPSQLTSH